jgi:3D (Asp-Asp-Asp) domain-containing protein
MKRFNRKIIAIISSVVTAVLVFATPATAFGVSQTAGAVRAEDSAGATQMSAVPAAPASAVKTKAPVVKECVYTARAKANGKGHVKLSWSKVKGAKGYTIYRSDDIDKLGKKIAIMENAARNYADGEAEVQKKHYYTIRAWKQAGDKKVVLAEIKTKRVKNHLNIKDSFTVKAYAYSGGGTTASGKKAQEGRIAVDPNVIALGTWLYVEDYGICQAADTGGAIKGKTVDLYMDTEQECNNWGVRQKKVYILE